MESSACVPSQLVSWPACVAIKQTVRCAIIIHNTEKVLTKNPVIWCTVDKQLHYQMKKFAPSETMMTPSLTPYQSHNSLGSLYSHILDSLVQL